MGIRASDHPTLMAAVNRQLDKDKAGKPEPPKVMWIMRTSMLKVKPYSSRDPVEFMKTVERVQEMNPGLKLYLFEVTGI